MTTSTPSKQYLKKLAGANVDSVRMIRQQLSTPDEADKAPKTQTSTPSPTVEIAATNNSKFETWQDLWISDNKPPADLDKKATQTLVFHYSIPAIMVELNNSIWDLPRDKRDNGKDVLVSGQLYNVDILNEKDSEVPIDIDKSNSSWATIGEETSWGFEYSKEVKDVLSSIAKHTDVPAWTSAWTIVRYSHLASVIAFGGITDIYEDYESARGEQETEEVILLVAESGGEAHETVVLAYGTKAPSTQVPMALAGRTSK